jgi:hypothetical protein
MSGQSSSVPSSVKREIERLYVSRLKPGIDATQMGEALQQASHKSISQQLPQSRAASGTLAQRPVQIGFGYLQGKAGAKPNRKPPATLYDAGCLVGQHFAR